MGDKRERGEEGGEMGGGKENGRGEEDGEMGGGKENVCGSGVKDRHVHQLST